MAMQKDHVVGLAFHNKISDIPFLIDRQDGHREGCQIPQDTPLDISTIKTVARRLRLDSLINHSTPAALSDPQAVFMPVGPFCHPSSGDKGGGSQYHHGHGRYS